MMMFKLTATSRTDVENWNRRTDVDKRKFNSGAYSEYAALWNCEMILDGRLS
jgi:hypothetical protein